MGLSPAVQILPRQRFCLLSVASAEERRVHEHGEELVQRHSILPSLTEWLDALVTAKNLARPWSTEKLQHGEIGLRMASMSCRVD